MQGHQQQGLAPFPYGSAAVPFQQLQPGGQAPAQLVKPPLLHEDSSELNLPITKVKRLIKIDADVKAVSQEATYAITKATELFAAELARRAGTKMQQQHRSMLQYKDVATAVSTWDKAKFLQEVVPHTVLASQLLAQWQAEAAALGLHIRPQQQLPQMQPQQHPSMQAHRMMAPQHQQQFQHQQPARPHMQGQMPGHMQGHMSGQMQGQMQGQMTGHMQSQMQGQMPGQARPQLQQQQQQQQQQHLLQAMAAQLHHSPQYVRPPVSGSMPQGARPAQPGLSQLPPHLLGQLGQLPAGQQPALQQFLAMQMARQQVPQQAVTQQGLPPPQGVPQQQQQQTPASVYQHQLQQAQGAMRLGMPLQAGVQQHLNGTSAGGQQQGGGQ